MRILKIADTFLDLIVILFFGIAGLYCAYSLWDNQQIYAAAENVRADMLLLKPEETEKELADPFKDLLEINPDICAWLTLHNTQIDYPVVQGMDNHTYLNTDVYGNYSLSGSIYLDSRNDPSFQDPYSLFYGHYMENHEMFGDLELYKDTTFFESNSTGTLILPKQAYQLHIFACLLVNSSDHIIFNPSQWKADVRKFLDYVQKEALHYRKDTIHVTRETPQILALSTCSYEFENARTIVLAFMEPYNQ